MSNTEMWFASVRWPLLPRKLISRAREGLIMFHPEVLGVSGVLTGSGLSVLALANTPTHASIQNGNHRASSTTGNSGRDATKWSLYPRSYSRTSQPSARRNRKRCRNAQTTMRNSSCASGFPAQFIGPCEKGKNAD